jgi:hypothetical protein
MMQTYQNPGGMMPKFMIAYHGGDKPNSKEEGMAHMGKWKEWVASLGDKIINPGTPLMSSKLLTASGTQDDTSQDSMNGYAIFTADDMDSALEIAKGDPFLQINGTLRVSQLMEM